MSYTKTSHQVCSFEPNNIGVENRWLVINGAQIVNLETGPWANSNQWAIWVLGSEFHVGRVEYIGLSAPEITVALAGMANQPRVETTFAGGGIGISDLRDAEVPAVEIHSFDLRNVPLEIYLESGSDELNLAYPYASKYRQLL